MGRLKIKLRNKIVSVLDCINKFTATSFTVDDAISKSSTIVDMVAKKTGYDIVKRHLLANKEEYRKLYERDENHVKKHLPQETSIINHLIDVIKITNGKKPYIIDVGGGNGILLHLAMTIIGCSGVVIDPVFPPGSVEEKINVNYTRITKSVSQVELDELDIKDNDVYIIGKHLCGTATDDTLKWIKKIGIIPKGIIIATCCFNKGDSTWTGRELVDFTDEQFEIIRNFAQWKDDKRQYMNDLSTSLAIILNWMRIEKMDNYTGTIVEYISPDISPKNLMLKFIYKT